jgi:peptidoglycan/LPS O-acetylase OafA/YrhL
MLHWSLLQRIFGSALGTLLGRISFVLDLIHVPIIGSLAAWMVLTLPSSIAVVTAAATTIFTVFAVSIATYSYMDQRPTAWSRSAGKLFDSLFGDRSAHQTV